MIKFRRRLALLICPELRPAPVALAARPAATAPNRAADPAMLDELRDHMVRLADLYAAHHGVGLWRVSFLVRGNGQFFGRLSGRHDPQGKGRAGCTLKTADTVFRWFDEHWPEDLEWPADIERPSVATKRRAS